MLKAWQSVFPGTVKSYHEMNASLMSHVRYPTDMFNIQRTMLNKYHVTNAHSFYAGDDVWSIPNDPTNDRNQPISPYYLSLQMPGDSRAHFSLTTTFIPQQSDSNSRNVMYGFLAANGDAVPVRMASVAPTTASYVCWSCRVLRWFPARVRLRISSTLMPRSRTS